MGVYQTLKKRIVTGLLAFALALSSVAGAFPLSASALTPGTVIVNGNTAAAENTEGWMFNRDTSTSSPYEFNAGAASIGAGSLYVQPISGANASDKFIAEHFLLSLIADVDTISYDFKIGSGGTAADANDFYLNVYANFGESSPTKFYDCRYSLVPTVGSTGAFTTVTFDLNDEYSVTTRGTSPYQCPASPKGMDLLSEDSTIRAFAINVGDTSTSDAGLDGYLDNVVVTGPAGSTIYDFDPYVPACSSDPTTFDTMTRGSVNGQEGWQATGPYDHAVVANTYGYESFGCNSLRLSNAVTSGAFGDQTFSYSTSNEAGELDAVNGGLSGGQRVSRFEAQFDFASASTEYQPGLFISVSPDRGDGARMSYLGFQDTESGIDVIFYDVQGEASEANFVGTTIATGLSREQVYTIKFVIDLVDGPSNDIVQIFINDELVHTGTTWENYYRFDPESQGSPHDESLENVSRTIDSLLFRAGGTAAPSTLGAGYLFDNVVIGVTDPTAPVVTISTVSTTTATPTITGTVDDPDATVTLSIDGTSFPAVNNGDGTWSYKVVTPLSNGSHQLIATATDAWDNSSSATSTLIVSLPTTTSTTTTTQPTSSSTPTNNQVIFQSVFTLGAGTGQGQVPDTDTSSTSTQDNVQGESSNNKPSNFLGLAWYWWIIIIIAGGVIIWWIIGFLRNNGQ